RLGGSGGRQKGEKLVELFVVLGHLPLGDDGLLLLDFGILAVLLGQLDALLDLVEGVVDVSADQLDFVSDLLLPLGDLVQVLGLLVGFEHRLKSLALYWGRTCSSIAEIALEIFDSTSSIAV